MECIEIKHNQKRGFSEKLIELLKNLKLFNKKKLKWGKWIRGSINSYWRLKNTIQRNINKNTGVSEGPGPWILKRKLFESLSHLFILGSNLIGFWKTLSAL